MTIQEFYSRMGGDYAEVVRRLGNEPRIKKVLGMLARDGSMPALDAALGQTDYEAAFRAAHTLKGVAMNLGLTQLAQVSAALTETLRPCKESEAIQPQFEQVRQCYTQTMEAVAQLLAENESGKVGEDDAAKK